MSMSSAYEGLYANFLEGIAPRLGYIDQHLVAFWPQVGPSYTGALMVVGKATNAWHEAAAFWPQQLQDGTERQRIVRESRNASEGDSAYPVTIHPSQSSDPWDEQHTRHANFFRVAEHLIGLQAVCWTNLYKLAPQEEGGNPDGKLRKAQVFSGAAHLLRAEIDELKPRRVVVMTTLEWFKPFADPLGITLERVGAGLVEAIADEQGRRWVIAKHPDRKRGGLSAYLPPVMRALGESEMPLH